MNDIGNVIGFWRFTELHYSQTSVQLGYNCGCVLEIYRITLLSNEKVKQKLDAVVLEIYRITLLSNVKFLNGTNTLVLEIYRITLLSNSC